MCPPLLNIYKDKRKLLCLQKSGAVAKFEHFISIVKISLKIAS